MLVLSRKQDEQIVIGEHVTISILKIRGNTVRIGIEAPRNIQVVRGELIPEEASCSTTDQPVTVEFKSHGNGQQDKTPSLRVISQEVELEIESDANGKIAGINRLQELVSKLAVEERQV